MVHGAAEAEVDLPPQSGGERARRRAAVSPRPQDRAGHRRGALPGGSALPRPARDGRARPEEGRDPRRAARPLADGLRRRRALCRSEPAAHARVCGPGGGHDRARDRHDLDAVEHARRARLPAVPGAAPRRRGHAGEHVPRQRLRVLLLSRVSGHPRPDEELRRRDRERAALDRRLQRRARGDTARPGRNAGVRQLLPRARRRTRGRARVPGGRRRGARPRRRRRPLVGLLAARVRRRPFRRRPGRSPERQGVHDRRRGAGDVHGAVHLRPSGLLRSARDGAACSRPARRRTFSWTATPAG